jgi:hypothetical protein
MSLAGSGELALRTWKCLPQEPGMMVHPLNPSSKEAEAGGWQVFEASLGYIERSCLKNKGAKRKKIKKCLPWELQLVSLCKCLISPSLKKGRLIICTIVLLISRAWENKGDV